MRTRSPTRRLASVVTAWAVVSSRARWVMTALSTPSSLSSSPRAIASTTAWTRSGGAAGVRAGCGVGRAARCDMTGWESTRRSRRCPQGRRWQPRVALEQLAQHHQRVRLLLAGGGQVGAQQAERLGAAHGAPAAGDLLGQLDHADVTLGLVVREWHAQVFEEPGHRPTSSVQPPKQVRRGWLLAAAALARVAGRWWVGRAPLGDDLVVAATGGRRVGQRQPFGHLRRPPLPRPGGGLLQLAQVMGIA